MKAFNRGTQFAWNSSSIGLAEECLRKYYLIMIEGWTPKTRSVHLRFGGLYATALERFHKFLAEGEDHEIALRTIIRETLIETWQDGAPEEFLHNAKTRENLIRTIVWYIDQFKDDSCVVLTNKEGKPAVEQSFLIDVDDGVVLCGHLDRLVDYAGDQYVMDQKTTGTTITPRYFEQFRPNTQMSLYSFAGKMILDSPVKGVIIDAAQIAVGFTRFERGFTYRTEDELNEWYDSAMYHIQAAQRATKEQHFPMNTSSCGNYGGCQFRHICGMSPASRERFLKADFEKGKVLDPLERR